MSQQQTQSEWTIGESTAAGYPFLQPFSQSAAQSSAANSVLLALLFGLVGFVGFWLSRRSRQPNHPAQNGVQIALGQRVPPTEWLGRAKDLEGAEQLAAARQAFAQGLEEHPNDFWLWYQQGLFLARQKLSEAAILSYDRAAELRPHDGELAHARADTLLELERFPEAVTALETALRYSPGSGHLLTDRAYALYCSGEYAMALQTLNRLLGRPTAESDRDTIRGHFYQIYCLRALGLVESARAAAQKAHGRYPQEQFLELVADL